MKKKDFISRFRLIYTRYRLHPCYTYNHAQTCDILASMLHHTVTGLHHAFGLSLKTTGVEN